MNTKKWKRFFKLDPHLDGGFTLVELIVVIAILAILAGVGAMAYSGYIKKANEAADEAMIAEVEQALLLGAYSGNFAPGTVGAVVLNIEENAVCSLDDNNGDDQGDIDAMMQASFGANWKETVQLKSDSFTGSDQALILGVVKDPANSAYFNSVPNSSFYGSDESTATLVTNVDEVAGAFSLILDGHPLATFWPREFREKVLGEELDYTSKNDDAAMTGANLTVLAAANVISTTDNTDRIASWSSDEDIELVTADGYVGDVVMLFAKYKAYVSYVENRADISDVDRRQVTRAYETLVTTLGNPDTYAEDGYLKGYQTAINKFKTDATATGKLATYYSEWQSGQAAIDANAFIGTMKALNAVEGNYVTAENAEMLKQQNAFTNNGAAELLNTMVSYSKMTGDLSGDYVITLVIEDDGTPRVTPTIQD